MSTIQLAKIKYTNNVYILGLTNPDSKLLYEKYNEQVEKFVKMLTFVMTKITLNLILWPMCFVSYITYFTTDAQSEAFQLPFFLW